MEKFLSLTVDNAKDIRNIYNQKEIENFIQEIISKKEIQEGNLENWLKSNLRNYIIKERPIKLIEALTEVVEDWAIAGVKSKTLSNVILDKQFQDQLLHVIDYLRTEYENKDLSRLTIPEAIKQSIDWTNNQKKVDDDEKGRTKILDCGDGYHIVEMFTQQALEYEGYAMKHCIGQYCVKPVVEKANRAFSLRDENNIPHVTILYDLDGEVIKE